MEKLSIVAIARGYLKTRRDGIFTEIQDINANERRFIAFAKYLEDEMPKKLRSRCKINMYLYGSWVEAHVKPKYGKKFTEHDTILITAWGASNEKWNFSKQLTSQGDWMHKMNRGQFLRGGRFEITFWSTSEVDGCRMERVVKTEEVVSYKVICD